MVSVAEAESLINQEHFKPKVVECTIEQAVGKVLAEEILADRDLPPFNRATMDGIAIASVSFINGNRKFRIKGVQPAGVPPLTLDNKDQCIEIMTGAVLPGAADSVVRYEDIKINNGHAEVLVNELTPGQNIHRKGTDALKGSTLLNTSEKISPAEIALFASIGRSIVKTFDSPRLAVVSTGDELVPIEATPEAWQIRTSNSYSIVAALTEMGFAASLHHLADDENSIRKNITPILDNNDVIILSGGVSKGKLDYVPGALAGYGIDKIFHEVSQRPGKPMWFGRGKNKTVFALPGNPVSTFMCFHRYVKPWLERSMSVRSRPQFARLSRDFQFKPPLTYFLQVSISNEQGIMVATPDAGGGSGDFANLRNVDGFLELTAEKSDFKAGDAFPFYPFRT